MLTERLRKKFALKISNIIHSPVFTLAHLCCSGLLKGHCPSPHFDHAWLSNLQDRVTISCWQIRTLRCKHAIGREHLSRIKSRQFSSLTKTQQTGFIYLGPVFYDPRYLLVILGSGLGDTFGKILFRLGDPGEIQVHQILGEVRLTLSNS